MTGRIGWQHVVPAVAALLLALCLVDTAAAAPVAHSKIQAERNLLHAYKALRRLDRRLVDRRTGLPRRGIVGDCRGKGPHLPAGWHRFVCTVSYRKVRVRVLYDAQRHNGFEIHRLP